MMMMMMMMIRGRGNDGGDNDEGYEGCIYIHSLYPHLIIYPRFPFEINVFIEMGRTSKKA
jgi:hypothetical protein